MDNPLNTRFPSLWVEDERSAANAWDGKGKKGGRGSLETCS